MKMTKEQLKRQLDDKKETVDQMQQHQPMETKTIEDLRLSLLAIAVYERF